MGAVLTSVGGALLATARQQRERLRAQEAALKRLQEARRRRAAAPAPPCPCPASPASSSRRLPAAAPAPRGRLAPCLAPCLALPSPPLAPLVGLWQVLEPPGFMAKVDADALWRAIDDARQAGVREEALQVAEKKLAEVTKPRWWEKAPRAPDRLGQLGDDRPLDALPSAAEEASLRAAAVAEQARMDRTTAENERRAGGDAVPVTVVGIPLDEASGPSAQADKGANVFASVGNWWEEVRPGWIFPKVKPSGSAQEQSGG